jgi:hypothetical protein
MAEIDMGNPNDIDAIVDEIMFFIPFRDKSIIASLDENDIPSLQYVFARHLSFKVLVDDGVGRNIAERVWKACRETHRVAGGEMKALAVTRIALLIISSPLSPAAS